MYQITRLLPCLLPLLTFRQTVSPDLPLLDDDLTATGGGRLLVNDLHPLLTPDNLTAVAPQADEWNATPWAADLAVTYGQIVRYAGRLWRATTADTLPAPGLNVAGWAPFAPLSVLLREKAQAATERVLESLVTRRKLGSGGAGGGGAALVQDAPLLPGAGAYVDKVIGQGRFVGLRLTVRGQNPNAAVTISALGAQLTAAQEGLPMYLYAEGLAQPLTVLMLALTPGVGYVWQTTLPDAFARLAPGTYYLGYYEDDLTGQAIFHQRRGDLSKEPCGGCDPAAVRDWRAWSPYLNVQAFVVAPEYVTAPGADGNDGDAPIFTQEAVVETPGNNYGLNLRLTIGCDLTEFLCRNAPLLRTAVGVQTALELVSELAYHTRNSGLSEQLRSLALLELKGDTGAVGLRTMLDRALDGLLFDTSGLDPLCLPCRTGQGTSTRAI